MLKYHVEGLITHRYLLSIIICTALFFRVSELRPVAYRGHLVGVSGALCMIELNACGTWSSESGPGRHAQETYSMRSLLALIVGSVVLTGVAQAQAVAGSSWPQPGSWYAEGVAQSAFGNVTSQSYGAEIGVGIGYGLQVFIEGGRIGDVATPATSAAAQLIAGAPELTQSGVVGYRVQQPVTFGVAGVKYVIPVGSPVQPYIMVGGGVAKVKQNVTFTVNGVDVTATLAQYGVTLGQDLSGSITSGMLTAGGGVMWPLWQHFLLDFQYRYGRIFDSSVQGINVSRAGIGVGVRF
jgi:opacity protein-like surface antigen